MKRKAVSRKWTFRGKGSVVLPLCLLIQVIFVVSVIRNCIMWHYPHSATLVHRFLGDASTSTSTTTTFEQQLRPLTTAVPPRMIRGLECIQIAGRRGLHSIEGIGAVFRLDQLGPFLASYYNVKFAMPSKPSEHGYDISHFFSDCGYRESYERFPAQCILEQDKILFEVCPRADCACLASQYHPHITALVRNGCTVVGIIPDRFKTLEFSGCFRSTLLRYFGSRGPPPNWEYDVIHYRRGDLASKPGGKSFSVWEFSTLMKALCAQSDRDIVVITEGTNVEAPRCRHEKTGKDRVVLAADTSISEALQIAQHAKTLSIGLSGFAFLIAEMASPSRMVLIEFQARFYRWVNCEKWTLVSKDSSAFNFATKVHMDFYTMSHSSLNRELRFLNPGDLKSIAFHPSLVTRTWNRDMMAPAILPVIEGPQASLTNVSLH